ncbi:MAG: type II toxin-antitoxin system VapC family toxin [Rhodobacteraceae bacterium]|nr:type II toxin-antitoxin system VapC family toxin [Paracoccaceae bacterium]
MLDTNIVSELARNPQGKVFQRIHEHGAEMICISAITSAELRFGCAKKGSLRLTAQIEAILSSLKVLAFDVPADVEYGCIRTALELAGTPIGPNDLLIGAHARAVDAVLVTANESEFSRIQGLKVENWLAVKID